MTDRKARILELWSTGRSRAEIARIVSSEHGVDQSSIYRDLDVMTQRTIPEMYGEAALGGLDRRVSAAVARAERYLSECWDELRKLQSGKYDYNTANGIRRPTPGPFLGAISDALKLWCDVTGSNFAAQVWSDKKKWEKARAQALTSIVGELDSMSDAQLREEALRLINKADLS